jgi:glycosyltransferase involved in cell wall biosynthesis
MKNLTLLIPAKNEAESLPEVLKELEAFGYSTVIILHQSDLKTIEAISHLNVKIVFQKNFGYGDALITGINEIDTELFCIFNADGSFKPGEIKDMMIKLETNNLDFVFGSRYNKNAKSDDDTIITLVGNYIFSTIGKIFFKLNINDILYTFVLGKTNKARELNLNSKDFGFCVELPIKANKKLMKLSTITSHERPRIAGKKKVNAFKDGFLILLKMIRLFFS